MTDLVHSGFASIPVCAEATGATMLEKAARALSDHFKCEWETMRDADREMIRGYVRAVLMAVRKQASDLEEYGEGHRAGWGHLNEFAPHSNAGVFAAMIDAILADGEGR